jgi:hypothetical protein
MPKTKYQLGDFLALVNDDCRNFAITIHEKLLEDGYKLKIQSTKTYGLHASYWQPKIKSVIGIIVYLLARDGKLMIRINADNHKKYSDVLNSLPENIVSQVDKADDCMKKLDPQKCWKGCMGYDFQIGNNHYHKCLLNCFLLNVDSESMPFLTELIENESRRRCAV